MELKGPGKNTLFHNKVLEIHTVPLPEILKKKKGERERETGDRKTNTEKEKSM